MIRLRGLLIRNVKNVREGELKFVDLAGGASITGIYGPNGSGKTTVINVLSCLKALLSGRPAPQECLDWARRDVNMEITATFDVDGDGVDYGIVIGTRPDPSADEPAIRLERERLTIHPKNGRPRLLLEHAVTGNSEGVVRRPVFSATPKSAWERLLDDPAMADIPFIQDRCFQAGRSFVFHPSLSEQLSTWNPTTKAGTDAMTRFVGPAARIMNALRVWADTHMFVVDTTRGAQVGLNWLPLTNLNTSHDVILDLLRPTAIPASRYRDVESIVSRLNEALGALVPGLAIEAAKMDPTRLPDDMARDPDTVIVEMFSIRGEDRIPLRCESEGIRRIVSFLVLLIEVFNDPQTMLAVDELDSGVFEFLLGELLSSMSTYGRGQLIFTAHNLHAVEMLNERSVYYTTVDEHHRFVTLKGLRPSNNPRATYLRSLVVGGTHDDFGTPATARGIARGFGKAARRD